MSNASYVCKLLVKTNKARKEMIKQITRITNQVKIIPRIRESYDDIKDKRRYRYGYITFGYIHTS
jgi:hypothetical protein